MPERLYHVVVIVERTGHKEYMTAIPVTHAEGCVLLSKLTRYPWRREQLEEVGAEECLCQDCQRHPEG